jgi:bacillithiol synthase
MECSCIRYNELPHTSSLFADLLYHPDRVRPYYPHISSDPGVYESIAREIQFDLSQRATLVDALREQNGDTAELDLLSHDGTVAVVTGQQVGLAGGPAYTIYKALTAVKLARRLTENGIPAVPVFWLATEDHDFAEVNHCWVFDASRHPAKLAIDGGAYTGRPAGGYVLAEPPLRPLHQIFAGLPYGDEVASLADEAYQPGRTMGQAFSALLKRLLGKFGLLHVDPLSPAIRQLAAPAIRAALGQASQLTSALLERNAALVTAGYHAQVHVEEQTSLVFLLENGRRYTLRRFGNDYLQNGRRFSTGELSARAAELSPNALLRPVVQDSMLPTVAYVGGPAELAYLAQSEVIYRAIAGRMPVALHRAGFTLLDAAGRKLMTRYGLTLADCTRGEEYVRNRIGERLIPPALSATVQRTRETVESALDRLAGELKDFDVSLAAALAKSRQKMVYQVGKMERKIGREAMTRETRVASEAAGLSALVYPQRHLQERFYSILPFLARHGIGLIDELYDCLNLDCPDHQLATV